MAVPIFTSFDAAISTCVATIKQNILKQSDWAHLQLSTGTQNTTLTALASAGATSVQVNTTIPSGSCIVIGNGAANPECRITTGVSGGSGAFIVTFADALVNGYSNGAAVGVGTYVKATTTRGAQMVIDLSDSAPVATNLQFAVYRTHDGTTGVDKLTRYIRISASATSNTIHCQVANSKEMIFISAEGPRGGETGALDSTFGSYMQSMALVDVVPYFGGDTVPTVCLIGHVTQAQNDNTPYGVVSRNQGNTSSWVQARLLSLQAPISPNIAPTQLSGYSQQFAKNDGNVYLWPYVVVEAIDGLRGRLNQLFFSGFEFAGNVALSGEGPPTVGAIVTYSGNTYKLIYALKANSGNVSCANAFGFGPNSTAATMYGPVIAVPTG